MNSDFLDAHHRHWHDAEQLFSADRWANADHLYGLAAECGLKRLMLAFGMPFDAGADRPDNRQDRVHANGAWTRYESYRAGYHQGVGYALSIANPFQDWDVSQRYASQVHFDKARTQSHRTGSDRIRQLVKKAAVEGLI